MEKIFFLVFLAFIAQLTSAQRTDTLVTGTASPQALHDLYMKKRKANITTGWILLGSGVAMMVGGSLINFNENFLNPRGNDSKGEWLAYVGIASTLGSIPLFYAARKNKLKARIALKGEPVTMENGILNQPPYPALVLTIRL